MQEITYDVLCAYCGDILQRKDIGGRIVFICNNCKFSLEVNDITPNLLNNVCCPFCFSSYFGLVLDNQVFGFCSNHNCPEYSVIPTPNRYDKFSSWFIRNDDFSSYVIINKGQLIVRVHSYFFGIDQEMNVPKKVWKLLYNVLYNSGYKIIKYRQKFSYRRVS